MKINIPMEELLILVSINGYYFIRFNDLYTIIHDTKSGFNEIKEEVVWIHNESLEVVSITRYKKYYWENIAKIEPTFYYMKNLKFLENYVEY